MSKRRAVQYLHLEAESGSEDYESEDISEDLDDFEPLNLPKTKSFKDLTRELEEKYQGEDEIEEEVLEIPSQSNLLPTPQSPLLFLVRCKVGKERDICLRIFERVKTQEICSVIQKEGLKGYLYIESYKKQAVEDVLSAVRNVSRRKFSVVPFKEMVEAISYKKNIVVSEFARIKNGKYKGDLVQVLENFEDVVKVKAIPRINNLKRRFDPIEYRSEAVAKDGGYYYNRDFYKDGYLEKIMLKSNLDFDVEPTFAELSELSLKSNFEINEHVKVSKGDLKNITGTIDCIKGNIAILKQDGRTYEVNIDDLEKFFEVGQEVSFRGENGIILSIKDKKVVLGMDEFTREVECTLNELKPAFSEQKLHNERLPKLKIRRDPILHRQARITGGEYKGLQGTVKDSFQDKCIIKLRSNAKEVTIDRRFMTLIDPIEKSYTEKKDTYDDNYGGKTPSFKTPAFKTPTYKTPSYKTPSAMSAKMSNSGYHLVEDAGTGWLASIYDGTVIMVSGKERVLSDIENGIFKSRTGETYLLYEIEYCMPEKYDKVVIMEGDGKGTEGILTSITGDSGVIRDKEGVIYDVELKRITKKIE